MGVSTGIPANWMVPLFFATVDGSQAGNLTEVLPALLVGQMGVATPGSAPTIGAPVKTSPGGAGGTMAMSSPGYGAGYMGGTYTVVCITRTVGAGTFEVLRPNGTVDGIASAGTPYSGQIRFTITASGTDFAVGDQFTVLVTPPVGVAAVGSAPVNIPVAVGSPALGTNFFGQGSMLDRMIKAFFQVNTTQMLYCLPVGDPAAGVAAVGTITISTGPSASGVLSIDIAGQLTSTFVAATDSANNVATNLAATINAMGDLPVTALATTNSVALTCKWKGSTGNDITIVPNQAGYNGGQSLPLGMSLTIAPMATGAGAPDFTAAISAIQTMEFDFVGLPYTDTGTQAVWAIEYGFGSSGRWNYSRQQYGMIVNAYRNDYADSITWGMGVNAPVISTMAIELTAPSPVWEWTAAYCGLAALGFSDDPARPLQTLRMLGLKPAPVKDRYSAAMRNNLADNGFAIQSVTNDGIAMIEREATQYQFNSFGQGDTAFGLLTVLATLSELLRRMKSAITSKYPRVKLIPDGTIIGPGQAAVTPTDIKAELISEFRQAMWDGLVAGGFSLQKFIDNLIVVISDTNPNQIQVLWPPQLAGQLRQFEVLAQFRLLYSPVPTN
jgi:phage tail sheath gpL-like